MMSVATRGVSEAREDEVPTTGDGDAIASSSSSSRSVVVRPLQPAYTTVRGREEGASPGPLLVPPLNFQTVAVGVSRSGHPNERNYGFLSRLKLKTIMYLANEDYRSSMTTFAEQSGIKVLHHSITVNKEPFASMEEDQVAQALAQLLDRRNYPILVHCNKGKYRVGCVIGILRRIQGWSYTSIFEEYARFAGSKAVDEEFIEAFDIAKVPIDPHYKPEWL